VSLVLASASPQRRAILEQLGLRFEVLAGDGRELTDGPAEEVAIENARRKARAAEAGGGATVLACDTVVELDGRLWGKPPDKHAARAGLDALSGREHLVVSGVCVAQGGKERAAAATTRVRFRTIDAALMDWYLRTGEWRERAGGYAVQGRGAALVTRIEGDYSNVVGLPVPLLLDLVPDLLARFGEAAR
jgi:septum formation protein